MKYHAIETDLHRANRNATEGAMMLNIGRGLIEAARSLQANDGDPERIDALHAEGVEYLISARIQIHKAIEFGAVIDMIQDERQIHQWRKEAAKG